MTFKVIQPIAWFYIDWSLFELYHSRTEWKTGAYGESFHYVSSIFIITVFRCMVMNINRYRKLTPFCGLSVTHYTKKLATNFALNLAVKILPQMLGFWFLCKTYSRIAVTIKNMFKEAYPLSEIISFSMCKSLSGLMSADVFNFNFTLATLKIEKNCHILCI